jgi:Tol biopolymer transport system component/DNA-binding winged helix-turn-helix (wHTH) protein
MTYYTSVSVAPTKLFAGSADRLAEPNVLLRVGEHVLDVGALRLTTRPDYPRLTSKALAVLLQLVRERGNTVTREQLLDRVWADRVTTPDVLTQAIKELRRAFADDAKPSRYIETIPKVGYRLLVNVAILDHDAAAPAESALPRQAGNDPYLEANVAPLVVKATPSAATATRSDLWLWFALAAIAVVVVAFLLRTAPSSPPSVGSWQVSDVRLLSSDPGPEDRPHVSPDGTRVAYSKADAQTGLERILQRAVGETRSLVWASAAKANEDTPVWSPDGKSIVFERVSDTACELAVASNLGGETRAIGNCQNPLTNYYDWTPDGASLITAERSSRTQGHLALLRWDLASGEKQPLDYARAAEADDLNAHYSPDGRWLAFRRGLAPYSDLWLMTADGRNAHQLTHLGASIRGYTWSRDSSALIMSSNHEGRFGLYAVDAYSATIQPLHVSPAEFPDAARNDDTVVYEIPRVQYKLAELSIGDDADTVRTLAPSTGSEIQPTYALTDDRIAFVSDRSGAQQLWLYDYATGATAALTDFRDSLLSNPSWSVDGRKVLITVRKSGLAQLFEIDLASRRLRLLSKSGDDVHSAQYGAEAESILLTLGVPGKDNQLLLLEHAGTAQEQRHLLESGLWYSEFDVATHRLYYSRSAHDGVFARTLSAHGDMSAETSVAPEIMDNWHVVEGHIWHFAPSRHTSKSTELLEVNPQGGSERVLAHLDAEPRDAAFSVSPRHDRILYVATGSEDTDIGALRLTHASTH